MYLAHLILVILASGACLGEEESPVANEVPTEPPSINLDKNLRRALLKALSELENEDRSVEGKELANRTFDQSFENASASAVSIYANSDEIISSTSKEDATTTSTTSTTQASSQKPYILLQKSKSSEPRTITTFEKENSTLDHISNVEQIITSASSSFTSGNNLGSVVKTSTTTKKPTQPTTIRPTTSTEESEAKAEEVQFFSAPLVAAFTVHQDEQGLPKKVEPIFKSVVAKKEPSIPTTAKPVHQAIIQKQVDFETKFLNNQLVQQKKLLEQEILRLKQQQAKQEEFFQQQLQKEKLIQEQIRLRTNDQPFRPIQNSFNQALKQQDFKNVQNSNKGFVNIQPSITFDPLVESGKLPLNAQILPVKNAVDFRSNPQFGVNSFNFPNTASHRFNIPAQSNRILRQESGTGNFVNDFPRTNNFNIQKSIQPFQQTGFNSFDQFNGPNSNRFFRSNLESSFGANQVNQNFAFNRPSDAFFRNNQQDTSFASSSKFPPIAFQQAQSPRPDSFRLDNLLYNSGAFNGKPHEDFNIITKVLSLNHLGGDNRFAASHNQPLRVVPLF